MSLPTVSYQDEEEHARAEHQAELDDIPEECNRIEEKSSDETVVVVDSLEKVFLDIAAVLVSVISVSWVPASHSR